MSKIPITIHLTREEFEASKRLLDELLDTQLFEKISIDCFTSLEAFVKAINDRQANEDVAATLDKKLSSYEWRLARCAECGHPADDHALLGTGICCIEGGCPCMKFKGQ